MQLMTLSEYLIFVLVLMICVAIGLSCFWIGIKSAKKSIKYFKQICLLKGILFGFIALLIIVPEMIIAAVTILIVLLL